MESSIGVIPGKMERVFTWKYPLSVLQKNEHKKVLLHYSVYLWRLGVFKSFLILFVTLYSSSSFSVLQFLKTPTKKKKTRKFRTIPSHTDNNYFKSSVYFSSCLMVINCHKYSANNANQSPKVQLQHLLYFKLPRQPVSIHCLLNFTAAVSCRAGA